MAVADGRRQALAGEARADGRSKLRPYLKRSSNAFLAPLDVDGDDPGVAGVEDAGELVCRSIVVRGAKNVHVLRSSFGATRAGILSFCVHSHRALVSNETHWMHAWRSTRHFEQR